MIFDSIGVGQFTMPNSTTPMSSEVSCAKLVGRGASFVIRITHSDQNNRHSQIYLTPSMSLRLIIALVKFLRMPSVRKINDLENQMELELRK